MLCVPSDALRHFQSCLQFVNHFFDGDSPHTKAGELLFSLSLPFLSLNRLLRKSSAIR